MTYTNAAQLATAGELPSEGRLIIQGDGSFLYLRGPAPVIDLAVLDRDRATEQILEIAETLDRATGKA